MIDENRTKETLIEELVELRHQVINLKASETEQKRVEKALRESEENFRLMVSEVKDYAILMLDSKGKITTWNEGAKRIKGYSSKEIIGKHFSRFYTKEDNEIGKPGLELMIATDVGRFEEVGWRVRKNGSKFWANVVITALRDEDGKLKGFSMVTRDITERNELENILRKSDKQASAAIEAARAFTFSYDIVTGKIEWDGAIEEITGYTREEFAKVDINDWAERIHPDDRDEILSILKDAMEKDRATAEYRFKTKKGYVTLSSLSITEKENGKPARLVGILQDITERKIAEGELQKHREHLEELVKERTEDLEKTNEKLKKEITERKEAEEKTTHQQKILNAINTVFKKALVCDREEDLANTCLEVAQELVGAKFGFFGEVNSDGKFDTLAISNPGWDACIMPESEATRIIKDMEIRGMQFLPLVEGKSRIFNDPSNHPDSVGTPEGHPKITSLLAVPLKYGGKVIGQIGLGNKEGGYDLNDQEAIEKLSVAMVEALMRKRAEDALRRSEQDLTLRNRIANIFLTHAEEGVYKEVLQVILTELQSKHGTFGYLDEDGALVVPTMTRDVWAKCQVQDKNIIFLPETWGDSTWVQAIREKKVTYSNEPSDNVPEGHIPIERHISMPIIYGGETIGLIQVANKKTDYTKDDLLLLENIGNSVAPILKARLQRDIEETARKDAEEDIIEAKERYDELIEGIPDAVYSALPDEKGTTVFMSARWKDWTGYSPEDFYEKPEIWINSIHPADRGRAVESYIEASKNKEEFVSEYRVVHKDTGEVRYLEDRGVPVINENGEVVRIDGIVTDITERRKAEIEQNRLNAELSMKNRELEQLLYVTSHDLRSPLVNVQGFSKELDNSLKEVISALENPDVPAEVKGKLANILMEDIPFSLDHILTSVSKMDSLLSGLLRLSRLGRETINIEPLDMNKVISDVTGSLKFQINEKGVKLEIGELPPCKGDETKVNQMFSNLMDNALKYMDPHRSGIIKISGQKKKDQSIYCVEDNGMGISPEHQEKIFQIFHRLDPQDNLEGEGLGLTIVKRTMERLGGNIWVESEPGKGSKFYAALPSKKGFNS